MRCSRSRTGRMKPHDLSSTSRSPVRGSQGPRRREGHQRLHVSRLLTLRHLEEGACAHATLRAQPPVTCARGRGETPAHRACKEAIWLALSEFANIQDLDVERKMGSIRPGVSFRVGGQWVGTEVQRSLRIPPNEITRIGHCDHLRLEIQIGAKRRRAGSTCGRPPPGSSSSRPSGRACARCAPPDRGWRRRPWARRDSRARPWSAAAT